MSELPSAGPNDLRARNILFVAEVDRKLDASLDVLHAAGAKVHLVRGPGIDLEAQVSAHLPDVLMLDLPVLTDQTLRGLRELAASHPTPLIVFVDEADDSSIQGAIGARVDAFVVRAASPDRLPALVQIAIARFEDRKLLYEELVKSRASLEERKIVERAKGLIMDRQGIPEARAYAALRKLAMDKSMRLPDVARELLARSNALS